MRLDLAEITINRVGERVENSICFECLAEFQAEGGSHAMSEQLMLELTKEQREMLLDGLQFVRSARALDMRSPQPGDDPQRKEELAEVDQLLQILQQVPPSTVDAGA